MIVYTPRHADDEDDACDVFKYRILKIYQYRITIITTAGREPRTATY